MPLAVPLLLGCFGLGGWHGIAPSPAVVAISRALDAASAACWRLICRSKPCCGPCAHRWGAEPVQADDSWRGPQRRDCYWPCSPARPCWCWWRWPLEISPGPAGWPGSRCRHCRPNCPAVLALPLAAPVPPPLGLTLLPPAWPGAWPRCCSRWWHRWPWGRLLCAGRLGHGPVWRNRSTALLLLFVLSPGSSPAAFGPAFHNLGLLWGRLLLEPAKTPLDQPGSGGAVMALAASAVVRGWPCSIGAFSGLALPLLTWPTAPTGRCDPCGKPCGRAGGRRAGSLPAEAPQFVFAVDD